MNHTMQNAELSVALNTIKELTCSGVELWREGDQVHYRATEGTLTPPILHWLKKNKTQLLNILSHGDPAHCSPGASVDRNLVVLGRGNLNHHVACVHAIDGSAGCYLDLAHELSRNGIGTYGIHAFDFERPDAMPTTIAEVASEYANQLIRVKPSEPFFLVGWSTGTLIAFEIAHELIRRGRELRRLILLDPTLVPFDSDGRALFEFQDVPRSVPPTGLPSTPSDAHERHWWKFLTLISADVATGGSYPLDPGFWDMDDRAKSEYLFENRRNQQLIKLRCMLHQANTPEDVLYIFKSIRNQSLAFAQYRPAFLQKSVSLFISADDISHTQAQIESRVAARENMWKNLSTGLDTSIRVPGGHTAVVGRPCVESVAQHIAASIWPQT